MTLSKPTIIKDFPGEAVDKYLKATGKLPSEHHLQVPSELMLLFSDPLRGPAINKFADDVQRELAAALKAQKIAELKASASLANNLCPDHRDKQNGKPCLACSLEEAQRDAEIRYMELQRSRAMSDHLIKRLVSIKSLMQADTVVLPDGRRFDFKPPDNLVRDAWEGLSAAIRDIDAAIDAQKEGL